MMKYLVIGLVLLMAGQCVQAETAQVGPFAMIVETDNKLIGSDHAIEYDDQTAYESVVQGDDGSATLAVYIYHKPITEDFANLTEFDGFTRRDAVLGDKPATMLVGEERTVVYQYLNQTTMVLIDSSFPSMEETAELVSSFHLLSVLV
jgi:hypothetical protein